VFSEFRSATITAEQAAELLGIGKRRVYQLYGDYLRACAQGAQNEWEPQRSGGDHRPDWSEDVQELLRKFLGAKPALSYSFAASEVLRRVGVRLDRASVRRWAIQEGLKPAKPGKRKPAAVRRWQCTQIGSLWQLDASPHRWLGEQAPLFPLFDLLDDCSRLITGARFYSRESLLAYFDFLPRAFQTYGLPVALYVDYHSFFFNHQPEALTQLGAALKFYDVSLKYAPTPQAKGKIERSHLFWQNRLPALFVVERVPHIAAANQVLETLRLHHNQQEIHREIRMTPQTAWETALKEHRSVIRPFPRCPWWPYVWSLRTSLKVGSDGRVQVGNQRLRVHLPPHTRLTRCVHPSGETTFLSQPPEPGKLPLVILHCRSSAKVQL
jgi:hypothetical protein